MRIELIDQKRTGLLPEHRGLTLGRAPHHRVRLTIPAREALEAHGAEIILEDPVEKFYQVTPGPTVPEGIVAVILTGPSPLGLRMENEPEYPGECEISRWAQVDFTPCPKCGHALIWYEAGFVPGYRVCCGPKHHHFIAR